MSKNYETSCGGDEPVTPIEEDFGDHNNLDELRNLEFGGMRKSMSTNDMASLTSDPMKLGYHNEHADHMHGRVTGTGELSRNKISGENLEYGEMRKSMSTNDIASLTSDPMKLGYNNEHADHMHGRVTTKFESMEAEEIKKFKIKANPIPKSVIEDCKNLPEVPKQLPTVPEPFQLTEVNNKLPLSPILVPAFKARPAPKHILEKPQVCPKQPILVTKPVTQKLPLSPILVPAFKARPAPKHILEKPQVCPKQPILVTKPVTQKFHYKPPRQAHNSPPKPPKSPEKLVRVRPLFPEPFSFEKRDEEIKHRREERIKKQLEEDRKQACQFKAQPIPGAVKKRMQITTVKCGSSSASSENKENCLKFDANPPSVLYKIPFKPLLSKSVHLSKPAPFHLNTEKRAATREIYDKKIKEKEEEERRERKKGLDKREREMEKASADLRAKLVHHPQPVPVVQKVFVPERSEVPVTVPETPKFMRKLQRKGH